MELGVDVTLHLAQNIIANTFQEFDDNFLRPPATSPAAIDPSGITVPTRYIFADNDTVCTRAKQLEVIAAPDAADEINLDTDHFGLSGANDAAFMAQFLGLLINNGETIAAEFCDPINDKTAAGNIFFP